LKESRREIIGSVNSTVVSETYFTYMRTQIKETFDITLREVIEFIKKDPDSIKKIDLEPVDMVFKIPNIYLMNVQQKALDSFGDSILTYGLLPNDTLHILTCYIYGIENIATNDSDFERVDFLKMWKP
jgi:predicted nucleic acid-binding protein